MKFGRLLANIIHRWGRAGHKYVLEWADLRHAPIPAGSILTVSMPAVSRRVDAASGHSANERGALPVSRWQK